MQPLWFLTSRSIVNGVRRALTSGRRLITLIFIILYYGFLVFRPTSSARSPLFMAKGSIPILTGPQIECGVFAFFSLMSFFMMVSILTPRGGFRPADIDILFTTPISPKIVLFFRLARDYFFTLLTPLILFLVGGRASLSMLAAFTHGMQGRAQVVGKMSAAAWLLMSFAWVCIGYGVSMLVNRSDLKSDRNKKIIDTTIFVAVMVVAATFAWSLRQNLSLQTAIDTSQAPLVRLVFFTSTAATWVVVGAMNGSYGYMALGFGVLLASVAAGLGIAISQIPYMYDQAAIRGFGASELRAMRRNNDFYGLVAQQARSGKLRIGRLSRFVGRIRITGAGALIWKEVVLQLRGARVLYLLFGPLQLFMALFPVFVVPDLNERNLRTTGIMLFFTQGIGVLMTTMNSSMSGFIELLKRVDFQKPLPFRPSGTVICEIASKCIPNWLYSGIAMTVIVIWRPLLWHYAISSTVFTLGLSLVVSSTVFLITVAFPDVNDPSQRAFRGIVTLLGTVCLATPGIAVLALFVIFMPGIPIIGTVVATGINVVVVVVMSLVSGAMYDSFNPSE